MKSFIEGKYYALTTDHWTSFAKENYGAITLYLFHDFQLHAFVLSCVKHENGCSAIKMERRLLSDLDLWELDQQLFISFFTDSASNINALGKKMEAWRDAAQLCHNYCADQILQRTAVLAYSGNIPSDYNEDNSVSSLQKTCDLVTYIC
jgi:hypothetical protein